MCNPLATPLACTANAVVSSGFGEIADSASQAAAYMVVQAMTWWTHTGSVNPDTDATHTLQGYTTPIVLAVLVCSVLVQAGRMIISRRKDPAINVGVGLIRYAAVTAGGLILLRLALQGADDLCTQLAGQAMTQFGAKMTGLMPGFAKDSLFLSFCLSLALMVLSGIQWLLGFVRQAGILVLAVLLPLAASGSINDSTRPWLKKLTGWLISLVSYKPMAAMIYLIGFTYVGDAQDLGAFMTGLMVLALAVVALPTMMKFFSWAGSADTSGGGAGGVLAAGALGAAGLSKLAGGSGGGAVQSAAAMDRSGPGSGSPPPTGSGTSAPTPGRGPSDSAGPQGGHGSSGAGAAGGTSSGASSAANAGGSAAGSSAAGGTAAGAAGGAASGAAGGAAAAAGPAGAAAAGAIQVAKGAAQAGQAVAGEMTDGGQQ
jgi:hypothetical protein